MPRRTDPNQENPPAEEQEENPPAEETEESQEEPAQEQDSEDQDPADEEEQQEEQEDPAEEPEEESAQEPATDEAETLRNQLIQTRGELAAYRAGVAPAMIADAVTLAMAEAAQSGAVTDASVAAAMEAVLKRHPEWKAAEGSKQKGGFKIGADRDNGGSDKRHTTPQNTKRWNRFK